MGRWARSVSAATIAGCAGKLLEYQCEGLGGDIGILLEVPVADGDESSHRGEEAHLECESAVRKLSSSNFCARFYAQMLVVYIEKMASEESLC